MRSALLMARLATLYAVTLIAAFGIFGALMYSDLLSGIAILFYRGIVGALVALVPVALILAAAARRFAVIDLPSAVGALALSLGFNLCFLVLLPVTIDRSVTVFLLARLDAQERPISEGELQTIFEDEYLGHLRQIRRRVEEQEMTGNVAASADGIALTANGRNFVALSRTIGHIFGADERFTAREVAAEPKPDQR